MKSGYILQEGRDKAYLLNMLQAANKKHKDRPKTPGRILSSGSEASGTLTSTAPGNVHTCLICSHYC